MFKICRYFETFVSVSTPFTPSLKLKIIHKKGHHATPPPPRYGTKVTDLDPRTQILNDRGEACEQRLTGAVGSRSNNYFPRGCPGVGCCCLDVYARSRFANIESFFRAAPLFKTDPEPRSGCSRVHSFVPIATHRHHRRRRAATLQAAAFSVTPDRRLRMLAYLQPTARSRRIRSWLHSGPPAGFAGIFHLRVIGIYYVEAIRKTQILGILKK